MNRRFRLAPVERLRASAVQDALRALGQARADLAARQARHASLVHELAGCDAPATTTPDGARLAGDRRALLR